MQGTANLDFVLKPLALSEFPPGACEDIDGGCLILGPSAWLALWKPEQVVSPDKVLRGAKARAELSGARLAGALLLVWPQNEHGPAVEELADALYVYGLNPLNGTATGLPDLVLVLDEQPPAPKRPAIAVGQASADEALAELMAQAGQSGESMIGPAGNISDTLDQLDLHTASADGQLAGYVAVRPMGLLSRIVSLWVPPDKREQGAGQALLRAAIAASTQRGEIRMFAFAPRDGKLRYYLNKQGFEDSMVALHFAAD